MEIANIAFHFERSGKRTVFAKHMKKRNLKDKVSGLLDEKRGKQSILGRYLNDVIRHTNYTRYENSADGWTAVGEGNKNQTGRRYPVPGNHDDYMDLAYCAAIKSSSEASFSDSEERGIRGSGDGSETPDTDGSDDMDTVTRGSLVYRERVVIGAETYHTQQTVHIDNHDDFIVRDNQPTKNRLVDAKSYKRVQFRITDDVQKLENHYDYHDNENLLTSQGPTTSQVQAMTRSNNQVCQETITNVKKVCYCGSDVMRVGGRKSDGKLEAKKEMTSLKHALKQRTTSKFQTLLNMYKSRKSQLKKSKKKSSALVKTKNTQGATDDRTKIDLEHEVLWNKNKQTDDNSRRDSFNFAFCDESSRVSGPCDQTRVNTTFVIRNIGENLIFIENDTNYKATYQNEHSSVSLCMSGQNNHTYENFVYFNDGFVLD